MIALETLLIVPVATAVVLGFIGARPLAPWVNIAACTATFGASVALAGDVVGGTPLLSPGHGFYVDAFSILLVVLTAFVGLTTALFSRRYMAHEEASGHVGPNRMRLYHAMFQAFLFSMLLALTTNNLGILWVALEGATLATVLLVSLYRKPESVEAAWKYFILCGVGIAQALFGTVLLYFAQARALGAMQGGALAWQAMHASAELLDPTVAALAFVFLLIGYGTKVGLVPLHNWLPDAHSEGPTPMSAMLSGLLLNVALYAVVRVKMLVDASLSANPGFHDPMLAGKLLMGFGLLSLLIAALLLHGQRDVKRLFSYSSIEHMGFATFAFGLGGPLATFAGLLHMAAHSLTKSALFVSVGHAIQIAGTQSIDRIRGLIRAQPSVGWAVLLGAVAIAGFPPFGLFVSEFLLLNAVAATQPWLAVLLAIALVVAFAGLFRHIQPMVYGQPGDDVQARAAGTAPVYLQLALVLVLGLAMPGFVTSWLDLATALIAGRSVMP